MNSVPGGFRLDVFAPQPPPRPPGPALPAAGVTRSVERHRQHERRLLDRHAGGHDLPRASRRRLRAARQLALYAPGTSDFDDASPVKRAGCGGYFLYTPAAGEGGRYSLLVTAQPRRRGDQRYHLQVAKATDDDTSPGLPLANYQRARGSLQRHRASTPSTSTASRSRVDSLLRVSLRGNGFKLQLLRDTGRRRGLERRRRDRAAGHAGALLPGRPLAADAVGPLRPAAAPHARSRARGSRSTASRSASAAPGQAVTRRRPAAPTGGRSASG